MQGKANFNVRQDLAKLDYLQISLHFTSEIMGAQYQCAPIRVKDKDSKAKEPWM